MRDRVQSLLLLIVSTIVALMAAEAMLRLALDSKDRWAVTIGMGLGHFRIAVEAPDDGVFRVVIANNLPNGQTANDASVGEVGLIGIDPARARAGRR